MNTEQQQVIRQKARQHLEQILAERAAKPKAKLVKRVAQAATPTDPPSDCVSCITTLVDSAERSHYKTLEFLLRAEAECGEHDDVRREIAGVRHALEASNPLRNLCEKTRNMLGVRK